MKDFLKLLTKTDEIKSQADYTMEFEEPPPELDKWELLDHINELTDALKEVKEWEIRARPYISAFKRGNSIKSLPMIDQKRILRNVDDLLLGDLYSHVNQLNTLPDDEIWLSHDGSLDSPIGVDYMVEVAWKYDDWTNKVPKLRAGDVEWQYVSSYRIVNNG